MPFVPEGGGTRTKGERLHLRIDKEKNREKYEIGDLYNVNSPCMRIIKRETKIIRLERGEMQLYKVL